MAYYGGYPQYPPRIPYGEYMAMRYGAPQYRRPYYPRQAYVPRAAQYAATAARYARPAIARASKGMRRLYAKYVNSRSKPTSKSSKRALAPAKAKSSANQREIVIEKEEYIGDIISSSSANTFKVQQWPINPGMGVTFPWLSQVAANFEMYQLESCCFEYRTFSCDALNTVNTALGSVIAVVDYDSSDTAFTSRSQMENSDLARSAKPSESFLMHVETRARQSFSGNKLYVRTTDLSAAADTNRAIDIKTYDVGQLYVATTGFQGTSVNAGSIYVKYRFRLFKPILDKPGSMNLTAILYPTDLSTVTASALFGTSLTSEFTRMTITQSGNVLTFPAGTLQIGACFYWEWYAFGSSTASVLPPAAPTLVGFDTIPAYYSLASLGQPSEAATSTTAARRGFVVYRGSNGTASAATMTFSSTNVVLPTSIIGAGFNMFQINGQAV